MLTAHRMKMNVPGRVRNTDVPIQNALLPLIEAIVNSTHATEERFGSEVALKGKVNVTIHRVPQPKMQGFQGRPPVGRVTGFTVVDNGCGFTDENLESFETADSEAKASRGGKGVGRFSWLVVFEKALVTSTFKGKDGGSLRRSFTFEPTETGISGFREDPSVLAELGTTVELNGVRKRYTEALRKGPEVVAERIFEHCFNYLVLGCCPRISVIDEDPDEHRTITVNEYLDGVTWSETAPLDVGPHKLNVLHVKQKYSAGMRHMALLCAHKRVVTSFPLSEICNLDAEPLRDAVLEENFMHHAFVSGDALDDAADSTWTRLDLPDGEPFLEAEGILDLKALRDALGEQVNIRLAEPLKVQLDENFRRIEKHIRTVQPEYRHLLTNKPDQVSRIKWTGNTRNLDESLYKVQQGWDTEIRQMQADLEVKMERQDVPPDDIAKELYSLVQQINETGQANLVRYVLKRRAVLQVIRRLLGKQALESHIHGIVFPLRATADDIRYDDHNLWLVDDTLSFYEALSSDISFSKNSSAPVDSSRRPDLLAFKTGDPPYQHIALVEFKRPERGDENPVHATCRVRRYVAGGRSQGC